MFTDIASFTTRYVAEQESWYATMTIASAALMASSILVAVLSRLFSRFLDNDEMPLSISFAAFGVATMSATSTVAMLVFGLLDSDQLSTTLDRIVIGTGTSPENVATALVRYLESTWPSFVHDDPSLTAILIAATTVSMLVILSIVASTLLLRGSDHAAAAPVAFSVSFFATLVGLALFSSSLETSAQDAVQAFARLAIRTGPTGLDAFLAPVQNP